VSSLINILKSKKSFSSSLSY